MKIPVDRKYIKISLYVVFTMTLFYAFKKIVDAAAFSVTNIDTVFKGLFRILGKVLSVFSVPVTAFVIAYLLDPVCDFFQRIFRSKFKTKSDKRIFGVVFTYILLLILGVVIFFIIRHYVSKGLPVALWIEECEKQIDAMYKNASELLKGYGLYDMFKSNFDSIWKRGESTAGKIGLGFLKYIGIIGKFLPDILLGFVIAFYFLLNKRRYLSEARLIFRKILPKRAYNFLGGALKDCDYVFSGYIRGQLTDGLIMSILIGAVLTIFKFRFSIFIGLFSGFSNIIPYFGSTIGIFMAVISALLEGKAAKAVYGAAIMIGLQQIDSVVIVPKIVGEKVKLSPVTVIIALAAGGKLFGILGMLFAVPAAGVLKIVLTKEHIKEM